jgi:hypothetical protein
MLNRRTLIWLGGGAAGSLALALVLGPTSPERSGPPSGAGTLAFPDVAAKLANIAKLELRKNDATLVVVRDGNRWLLPDKGNYPVRAERVRETLVGLTELRLVEQRTNDRAQLAQLGLDDPTNSGSTAVLLRALDANGAVVVELIVGRRRVRTQGNLPESVYVRRPGETQAWLGEGRLALDTDPQLWVDRDLGNISAERLRRVVVNRVTEGVLVLERGGEADAKLKLVEPPNPPSQDEVALDEVGRAFEFLTFLDVKPAAEIPGEALGEARFEFTNALAITVWPSMAGDTLWVRLKAEGDEAAAFNARWDGWAYQVGIWKEKAFAPKLADLMERERAPVPAQPQ